MKKKKTYIIRIHNNDESIRFAVDLDEDELRGVEKVASISEGMAAGYEPRLEIWNTEKGNEAPCD